MLMSELRAVIPPSVALLLVTFSSAVSPPQEGA